MCRLWCQLFFNNRSKEAVGPEYRLACCITVRNASWFIGYKDLPAEE